MSYQIKSTPFFRRMVNASKKNGQLQRLKEEYERIKDFNDRTIEMKMRQVRLKRLFREIEEIKESSLQWKRRRVAIDRLRTNEEIRIETLVKAKELGKKYSEMNALADRCASRIDAMASGAAVGSMSSRIELERKARSDKRISYGNDRSRMNIQKIATTPRKPVNKPILSAEQELKELKDKLRNRLSFGNSCSSRNLAKKHKKDGQRKATAGKSLSALPCVEYEKITAYRDTNWNITRDIADSVERDFEVPVSIYRQTAPEYKLIEDVHISLPVANPKLTDVSLRNEQDRRMRAKERWRKLALIVRHRFDKTLRRHVPPSEEQDSEESREEYPLRLISNHTDLPKCNLRSQASSKPHSDDELENDEVLVSIESLDPLELQPLPQPIPAIVAQPVAEEISNPIEKRRQVQNYVKVLEPVVRVARKQAVELSVEQLRGIFEHQCAEL
ncbi:uncharacterized protein LOC105664914 [Ceratitis capitata]|uniref:uncharacterized protein LOC105664914 n=1 Tax=Ceratitis capitata TaxID=7213 RepID=UPI000618875B|nr:uncharacterized protein LOC105664914 [Ceratitis capitata]